jgi:hypothetical protein
MALLAQLKPSNLLEEKEKFFLDNSYNPQFVYEADISEKSLSKYGFTQKKYLELAQEIIKKAYFNRTEDDLQKLKGQPISQLEATDKLNQFLKMHHLENRFNIMWSASFVARTSINANTIKLRLPVDYRDQEFLGVIYHEVGTHGLRRINYEQQPFFKRKKKHGLITPYLVTEEGLAILHSLLPMQYKSAYSSAIRYLLVDKAQKSSFAETYKLALKYIQDPNRAWTATFRQKRGLEDTSQPGGFTKDLVYFQGVVEVWNYLKENDFDITDLYRGKIAHQDIDKAVKINPNFKPILPSFFEVDQEKYKQNIGQIGVDNFLI